MSNDRVTGLVPHVALGGAREDPVKAAHEPLLLVILGAKGRYAPDSRTNALIAGLQNGDLLLTDDAGKS